MVKSSIFILFGLIIFASCKKKELDTGPQDTRPPVAKAGDNQKIFLSKGIIVLDGSLSFDYNRDHLNYLWSMVSGPVSPKFSNVQAPVLEIREFAIGIYEFALRVANSRGAFDIDTVLVQVVRDVVQPPPSYDLFYSGNVFFYCPDPTGTMPLPDNTGYISPWIYWTTISDDLYILFDIRIDTLTGILAGIWSSDGRKPNCPPDYNTEPGNAASFKLQPGTYTWTAENRTDLGQLLFATNAFNSFLNTPHKASGTVTISSVNDCIVVPIIF